MNTQTVTGAAYAAGALISAFGFGLFFGLGFVHAIRWAVKRGGGLPVRINNLTVRYVDMTSGESAVFKEADA